MATEYVVMPLFDDEDYEYQIALEGNSYTFRAYYNSRTELWHFDLSTEDGTPVVLGEALVPNYPILWDYALFPLTGYIFLEPISDNNIEKYKSNPRALSSYYRMFWIWGAPD